MKITKKELSKKMTALFWKAYEDCSCGFIPETSEYWKLLRELDSGFAAGEVSEKIIRWAHEIDERLNDVAQA